MTDFTIVLICITAISVGFLVGYVVGKESAR